VSENIETNRTEAGSFKFELDRKAALTGHIRAASPDRKIGVPGKGTHDPKRAEEIRQTE